MKKTLLLFDVDGTLTVPMKKIDDSFKQKIQVLRSKYLVGVVGGSNIEKMFYQLGDTLLTDYDYVFAENGLMAYYNNNLIGITKLQTAIPDYDIQDFLLFVQKYIDDLKLPIKRTKHIEMRNGMINISPIGRDCTYEERIEFYNYDTEHKIRETMIDVLYEKFNHLGLVHALGGMISFDTYPKGWDKTFCLRYLDDIDTIHFFGDKTEVGGNDHALYIHNRVIGHKVSNCVETEEIITNNFL